MTKRVLKATDLLSFDFIGTPKLSPKKKAVVYTVTQANLELNGYQSSLFLVKLGSSPLQLTHFKVKNTLIRDQDPVWSSDSKTIYFLSNRSEKTQVWSISTEGGEATQVSDFEEDVTSFILSPKNDRLICQLSVPDHLTESEDGNEEVTIITRLRYLSNGTGFIKKTSHLASLSLESGETKRLTEGHFSAHSPSFTPDGKTVIFLKTKESPEQHDYFNDIYSLDLSSSKETKLYSGKGYVQAPTVSPDGGLIAFTGHESGEISPDNSSIWVLPISGGTARSLTQKWDRPVGNYVGTDSNLDSGGDSFQWDSNSQGLIFTSTEGGNCFLKHVDLEGNVTTHVQTGEGVVFSFDRQEDDVVYNFGTALDLGQLYLHSEAETSQLTSYNEALLKELDLAIPEKITYQSVDDWTIEGWVLLPPRSIRPETSIPVVLEIHGGPHTAYGNVFHHEFQLLAANGYAVVYTNPRGSQGYGRDFTAACIGDWGQKDQQDILTGLDAALENYSILDRENHFVTGGSYGGFMTNMIVSHTDRFKAAVTQRCISNMYSFFGTSDIGYYFGEKQLGNVDLWEDEDAILHFSPIRYARNVKTPTCIIHSEEDYRCPIEQAEQWYVALRRLGVETRFVRFKGENHELSRSGKPENRLTRLKEILDWFNNH